MPLHQSAIVQTCYTYIFPIKMILEIPNRRRGGGGLLPGAKELLERSIQDFVWDLHVSARGGAKFQPTLAVQLPETQPVLRVDLSGPQRGHRLTVHLLKPRRLLGDDGRVVLEQIHNEVVERGNVGLVLRVLDGPLV